MGGRRKIEVLVAGAGPVGLATALMLAKRDIQVDVIDEQWRAASRSYALALHPSTLQLLDEVGIAKDLVRAGRTLERIAFYEGHERKSDVTFRELDGPFPFLLVLPQSALEEALVKELEKLNVRVQWNRRLAWLDTNKELPVAEIETLEKESSGYGIARTEWAVQSVGETEAAFVIGADGHRSIVRRELESSFDELGPAESFAVFEFAADYTDDEVRVVFDDEESAVLWPLGGGRFRFNFSVREHELVRRPAKSRLYVQVDDESFPHLGADHLRQLIRTRAPWFDADVSDLAWSLGVRFETRLVSTIGQQRVWLAGDAAHIGGPVGVHSMNRGIQEGHALQAAMHGILRKGDPLQRLEDEGSSLREPWERLMADPTVNDDAPPWVRRFSTRVPRCLPASGADLEALMGQLGLSLAER
jgi:2-polyprenyl-6-methoxyphenol hydroxylase-like FAD-dependent oxidoreductase